MKLQKRSRSYRQRRVHTAHGCGLLLQMRHVAWSVCLCVGNMGKLCKNDRTDRDAVLVPYGPTEYCLDGGGSAADEFIHRREGWQHGDAAFCQITLDTCCRWSDMLFEGAVGSCISFWFIFSHLTVMHITVMHITIWLCWLFFLSMMRYYSSVIVLKSILVCHVRLINRLLTQELLFIS